MAAAAAPGKEKVKYFTLLYFTSTAVLVVACWDPAAAVAASAMASTSTAVLVVACWDPATAAADVVPGK